MLAEAAKLRSKNMYPALVLDLNCGLRDKELRELRWQQIDLVHKKQLTVGKSKTDAGTGRVIPLNDTVMIALEAHAAWYIRRFGECKPEWYVFHAGKGQPDDPTRAVTTLRMAWTKVRGKAKVAGRWHDNRHTLVTELAESGAGDEVIMSIAGHVSRAMLSRYSHGHRDPAEESRARRECVAAEHCRPTRRDRRRRGGVTILKPGAAGRYARPLSLKPHGGTTLMIRPDFAAMSDRDLLVGLLTSFYDFKEHLARNGNPGLWRGTQCSDHAYLTS
jgi:hypothetical protein